MTENQPIKMTAGELMKLPEFQHCDTCYYYSNYFSVFPWCRKLKKEVKPTTKRCKQYAVSATQLLLDGKYELVFSKDGK